MTKTLAVLSIFVPMTVPTNCAMLEFQIPIHVRVNKISRLFQVQALAVENQATLLYVSQTKEEKCLCLCGKRSLEAQTNAA